MNEATRQAYLDKAAAQMREWGANIELLNAKLAKSSAGVRVEYNKHLEGWSEMESAFKQKIEDLRSSSEDGFETLKASAQTAWSEINTFIKSLEEKTNDFRN